MTWRWGLKEDSTQCSNNCLYTHPPPPPPPMAREVIHCHGSVISGCDTQVKSFASWMLLLLLFFVNETEGLEKKRNTSCYKAPYPFIPFAPQASQELEASKHFKGAKLLMIKEGKHCTLILKVRYIKCSHTPRTYRNTTWRQRLCYWRAAFVLFQLYSSMGGLVYVRYVSKRYF